MVIVVGAFAWGGTTYGGDGGEHLGEVIYESDLL